MFAGAPCGLPRSAALLAADAECTVSCLIRLQVQPSVPGLKALDLKMAENSMMTGLLYSVRQQSQLKGSLPKARLQPEPVVRSARQQARRAQHSAGEHNVMMDSSNGA